MLRSHLKQLTDEFTRLHGDQGLERVSGEELMPERLGELFQGVSLFTPQRMVIMRHASQNKVLWEALGEWVSKVPEETDVVIVENIPDKRTKTFKLLVKVAEAFEAKEVNEVTAVEWVAKEAEVRKSHIGRKEAQLLVDRVGADQSRLSQELHKLVVHPKITSDLIVAITEATPQATAFELLDAVLNRQVTKTQSIIAELQGVEEPYKLFGLLSSQLYALAVVIAAGSKVSTQQIAKDTGLHPFVLGKVSRIARTTSWTEVSVMTDQLADLDDKMKSTGIESWLLLETTLLKMASR